MPMAPMSGLTQAIVEPRARRSPAKVPPPPKVIDHEAIAAPEAASLNPATRRHVRRRPVHGNNSSMWPAAQQDTRMDSSIELDRPGGLTVEDMLTEAR
jgi:hypothetical protein